MNLCWPGLVGNALQAWSATCTRTASLKVFALNRSALTLTGCAAYRTCAMSALTEKNKENQAASQVPPVKLQKVDAISTLQVKLLSDAATVPRRGSARAAGYDLASAADCIVPARGKAVVPTDLAIAIPPNTYARVAPRSGLAVKHFIDTAAGVVDEDYRGAVGVVLYNHGSDDFIVKKGDRIAQLILERIMTPDVEVVQELGSTVRGAGGYGSTGVGG